MKIFRRDRCYNGGTRHKFEARYSERNSRRIFGESRGYSGEDIRRLINLNEYEHDICVWCGEVKTSLGGQEMKILRLGERVLTIHDTPFEWDAFKHLPNYDGWVKTILNKSGGNYEQKGQSRTCQGRADPFGFCNRG